MPRGNRTEAMRSLARTAYHIEDSDNVTPWPLERRLVANFRLAMLAACGGHRGRTAIELGISVRALRGFLARMRRKGLHIPFTYQFDPGPLPTTIRQEFDRWASIQNPIIDLRSMP